MKRLRSLKISLSKKILLIFTMGVLSIFLVSCTSKFEETSIMQNATIDLSDWDFDQYPEIILSGESLFYWKQWPIDQDKNYDLSLLTSVDTISWPTALWKQKIDEAKGYGTFRIFVKRPNTQNSLLLTLPRCFAAAQVWINGKKIVEHGKISQKAHQEHIDGRPLRVELPNENNLDIMLLVSNHKHRSGGGFALRSKIQEAEYFINKNKTKLLIEGVITFLILIFGVYQLLYFVSFPKYSYFLYFGLFCLFGASRQLFVGEALIYYFFPDISFEIVQKMRYIGYYGALGAVLMYHFSLFPGYFSSKWVRLSTLIPAFGILYVMVAPVFYATYSAPFFQVFGLIVILIGFYQMIRAIKDKRPYARGMFISLAITSVILINDLLNAVLVIQTQYLINYGLLLYVGFQIVLNNRMQKEAQRQLIKLSTDMATMSDRIVEKEEEILELRSETFQQLKSKEKLVENLKKVASKDNTISIQNLIAELKSELIEDSQLNLIKSDIETLNYEFAKRMAKVHPNLTKTDLEICTYLRMSLGRKEIARLRFTSLDAVKKSRSRLRKKMNLTEDVNLEEYIKSI